MAPVVKWSGVGGTGTTLTTIDKLMMTDEPQHSAQHCIMEESRAALKMILRSTREILEYVDTLLDSGDDVLLDPKKHDDLLFDDDVFSRSRKYWWARNLLDALKENIQKNLKAYGEFVDHLILPIVNTRPDTESREWNALCSRNDWGIKMVESLKELLTRSDSQRERAEVLRNAVSFMVFGLHPMTNASSKLFTASGVVESRASTRLGETVKLLTYVSIFYLPLTFSTVR
jgi:hypothetical protein